jgi:hypothetical protein
MREQFFDEPIREQSLGYIKEWARLEGVSSEKALPYCVV